jgi:HEAT repeat protein
LRREEILSLKEFEEDTDIGYWANILVTSHDRSTLQRAITELEWIGSDAAVAAIAIVLGDDDALLRRHAVESLGNMNSDQTAPLLGQALIGDKDSSVRMTAVKIFASQRNEISQAFLTTALKDPDPRIKALASQALSFFNRPN